MSKANWLKNLQNKGYYTVPGMLDTSMLRVLSERFNTITLSDTPDGKFSVWGAFIAPDYRDPVMANLLTWPRTLDMLHELGFASPKLHSFYVSTKPPRSAALAWHSDLFYRYEEPAPAELFLIYYLQDTTPYNGCLRVVPGSHHWSHEKRHQQPEDARVRDDEVDVSVKAGTLFIGDRRLLHATHANTTDSWRTCVTIAFAPDFTALAEPIQALIVQNQCLPPKGWWDDKPLKSAIDIRLQAILPVYKGKAKPIATE